MSASVTEHSDVTNRTSELFGPALLPDQDDPIGTTGVRWWLAPDYQPLACVCQHPQARRDTAAVELIPFVTSDGPPHLPLQPVSGRRRQLSHRTPGQDGHAAAGWVQVSRELVRLVRTEPHRGPVEIHSQCAEDAVVRRVIVGRANR